MDSKKFKQLLKNKRSTKVTVADDTVVDFFKPLLKEIKKVFHFDDGPFSFSSDQSCLAISLGLIYEDINLNRQHIKFICKNLSQAFGCPVDEKQLTEKLATFLPWLNTHRTISPVTHQAPNFLGIKNISDNEGSWKLSYFFSLRSHVDYFNGWIFGKKDPLGKAKPEMVKSMLDAHKEMESKVYGINSHNQYLITTEEGDTIICHNILQVCNWVIARTSNYVPGKKESW